jgi:ABC-type proline/glycine betaine transport system substrate-binding protein
VPARRGPFFRNRRPRFFTLALPVLFLVIFASVFTGTAKVAGRSAPRSTTSPASSRWRSSAPHSAIQVRVLDPYSYTLEVM